MLGRGFNPRGMETCRGSIPPPLRLHSCFCGFPWLGHGEFADARHAHAGRAPKCKRKGMERNTGCCQRPYRVECTGSLPNSEVKRHRARLVLGWGTAWEDLRVLSAFSFFLLPCKYTLSTPKRCRLHHMFFLRAPATNERILLFSACNTRNT